MHSVHTDISPNPSILIWLCFFDKSNIMLSKKSMLKDLNQISFIYPHSTLIQSIGDRVVEDCIPFKIAFRYRINFTLFSLLNVSTVFIWFPTIKSGTHTHNEYIEIEIPRRHPFEIYIRWKCA